MNDQAPAAPQGSQNRALPPLAPDGKPRTYLATISEIVQATPDVRLFRLTLDGYSQIMPFKAGQFLQTIRHVPDAARPGQTKEVVRSYSIASSPDEKNFVELCIKLVPDGTFTPTLWDMNEGEKIDLRGPFGKFIAREPVDYDSVFIAAGTGIAPFRGMIQHTLASGVRNNIVLVFGVRYEEDVLYETEFRALAAKHPNFKPVFTLSRPRHPEKWAGDIGYVQTLLAKHIKNPANTHVFICGLTPMINASVAELEKLGVSKDRIHYERYD